MANPLPLEVHSTVEAQGTIVAPTVVRNPSFTTFHKGVARSIRMRVILLLQAIVCAIMDPAAGEPGAYSVGCVCVWGGGGGFEVSMVRANHRLMT